MRLHYWDSWKGIAILAVILIHASGHTGKFAVNSFNWEFGLILRQFVNIAVPMFFAMAGYFAINNKKNNKYKNVLGFYKSRFLRVFSPYIFWTFVFLVLASPATLLSIVGMLKSIILGTGIGIGYFVIVLFQFIVLTPIINKIKNNTYCHYDYDDNIRHYIYLLSKY